MPDSNELPVEATALCAVCLEIADVENPEVDKPCLQCKHFYCKAHTSSVDADYCDNCLRPKGVETTTQALVDEDGVKHEGRKIVLTGEFWMSMQRDIISMTDPELIAHVNSLRAAVREIELIRDYRQIALAHGENELEGRSKSKITRLRLLDGVRGGKITAQKVVEMKKRVARPKSVDQIFEQLKSLGLTKEQLESALRLASKAGKK